VRLVLGEPRLFALFFFEEGFGGTHYSPRKSPKEERSAYSQTVFIERAYVVLRVYIYNENSLSLSLSLFTRCSSRRQSS